MSPCLSQLVALLMQTILMIPFYVSYRVFLFDIQTRQMHDNQIIERFLASSRRATLLS